MANCPECERLLDDDGFCGECDSNVFEYPYPDFTVDMYDDPPRPLPSDPVNNPAHYGQGSIECIEYIQDFLNDDEYIGYLRGNIAKYLHRWRYKNGVEDLKKAQWYLTELLDYTQD